MKKPLAERVGVEKKLEHELLWVVPRAEVYVNYLRGVSMQQREHFSTAVAVAHEAAEAPLELLVKYAFQWVVHVLIVPGFCEAEFWLWRFAAVFQVEPVSHPAVHLAADGAQRIVIAVDPQEAPDNVHTDHVSSRAHAPVARDFPVHVEALSAQPVDAILEEELLWSHFQHAMEAEVLVCEVKEFDAVVLELLLQLVHLLARDIFGEIVTCKDAVYVADSL